MEYSGEDEKKLSKDIEETPMIKRAAEILASMTLNAEEREIYEQQLKELTDAQMGIKPTEKKVIETVKREEENYKLGLTKQAKSCKESGVPIDIIKQITGFTDEEIENL